MHTAQSPLKKWGVLVVLSLALAIIIIDTTLLNVALKTIILDLKTTLQNIQWVISAYSLTLAALTITGGRLGDLFGRKRMFMIGAVLFAIGSFIASISTSVGMMVIGESIVEGIGAALMMPATSSLLLANFQGRERAIAFGVWGGIAGGASAIGPLLGGYLTTNYSWRLGFRINIFVVVLLLLGSFIIKDSRDTEHKPQLDWLGIFLSALGMTSLVFGVIEASTYGWWKAKEIFAIGAHTLSFGSLSIVPVSIALGLVILGLFVLWERVREDRNQTPLVSMHLFQNKQFTAGVITTTIISLGMAGLVFTLPVFFQTVRGFSAFETGKALLPLSISLLIVAPLGAALSGKIRPKYMMMAGTLLGALAFLVIRYSLHVDATALTIAPGLALYGIGMGLTFSQINNYTLSAVPVQEAGEASGINNTLRQVGSSFGSAIIGAILLSTLPTFLNTNIQNSTVIPDQLKTTISQAVTKESSNIEFSGVQTNGTIPVKISEELSKLSQVATVDADKVTFLYGALIALIGFIATTTLPNIDPSEKKKTGQPVSAH